MTLRTSSDAYLYDQAYFDGYYLKDKKRDRAYLQERDRIYRRFLKNHEQIGGNVLDVGCGLGGFLMNFDDRWQRYGIEPSDYAAKKASNKGIEIVDLQGDLPEMDLVIFRGTLQHISRPMDALVRTRHVMKDNGLLAILATPDTDSLVYKLWGNLPPLDAPRNWVLFGHRALGNILVRLGYSTEFIYPYWDTPYARPARDLAKFIFSLFIGYRKFAFPGNMMEVYCKPLAK